MQIIDTISRKPNLTEIKQLNNAEQPKRHVIEYNANSREMSTADLLCSQLPQFQTSQILSINPEKPLNEQIKKVSKGIGIPLGLTLSALALTGCGKDSNANFDQPQIIPQEQVLKQPVSNMPPEYLQGQNLAASSGSINNCYTLPANQALCIQGYNDRLRGNTNTVITQQAPAAVPQKQPQPIIAEPQQVQEQPHQPPVQTNQAPSSGDELEIDLGDESGSVQTPPQNPNQNQTAQFPVPTRKPGRIKKAITAFRNFLSEDGSQPATISRQNQPSQPAIQKARLVSNIGEACKNALPAVVTVHAGREIGSGTIVDPKGLVITNNHVVRRGGDITVDLTNGTKISGSVIATDKPNDLALIKLESGNYPTITLASGTPSPGEELCAAGSPYGQPNVITTGTFANTRGEGDLVSKVPLKPGNSGGPLINKRGEQVGVNKGVPPKEAVNNGADPNTSFATSADVAKQFISQNSR